MRSLVQAGRLGHSFALCGPGFCGCGLVEVSAGGWADFTRLMTDQDNGELRRSAVAGSGGAIALWLIGAWLSAITHAYTHPQTSKH